MTNEQTTTNKGGDTPNTIPTGERKDEQGNSRDTGVETKETPVLDSQIDTGATNNQISEQRKTEDTTLNNNLPLD